MYRLFALLLATSFVVPFLSVHAQSFAGADPLTITISPENPRPYETITVTPKSNSINLISGTLQVSVNGKVVESGSGGASVPVTVGGPGERTVITARATVEGQSYTDEVTIRPADVALVVDPTSTVHPLYRGASLVSPEGRVRVVAVADLRTSPGTRLAAGSLVYTWKLGDQILADQSGIGRSVLVATAPVRYRDAQVSVAVTSPDVANLVAGAATVISPVDPIARIYRDDPLIGPLFDQALSDTYTMTHAEESLRGVAYFFGVPPSLSWSVNGEVSSSDKDVTIRTTGSGAGSAALAFTASGAGNRSAVAQLLVSFGAKKGTGLFGF